MEQLFKCKCPVGGEVIFYLQNDNKKITNAMVGTTVQNMKLYLICLIWNWMREWVIFVLCVFCFGGALWVAWLVLHLSLLIKDDSRVTFAQNTTSCKNNNKNINQKHLFILESEENLLFVLTDFLKRCINNCQLQLGAFVAVFVPKLSQQIKIN